MPIQSNLPAIDIPNIPFHEMILNEIEKYKSRTALIDHDNGTSITYDEIIEKSKYVAKSLLSLGIEKGEAVILCVSMSTEFLWLFLGISMAGAMVCCLSPEFSIEEMKFQIIDSITRFAFVAPNAIKNLTVVFSSLEYAHRTVCVGKREESCGYPIIEDLKLSSDAWTKPLPAIDAVNDFVMLPYSCGTSGPRKGVAISHYILNGMIQIFNNKDAYDLPECGESVMIKVSVHDAFGRDALFSSLINGATVICTAKSEEIIAKCIESYKVRTCFLSPFILKRLCVPDIAGKMCLSSLKTVVIGTAKADETTMKMAFKLLPSVTAYSAVYGMTEVGSISRTQKNIPFNNQSCGSLCSGLSLKVVNLLNGKELPEYSQGLILISGETVMSPYWNDDKATKDDFKYDGWRNTGTLFISPEVGTRKLLMVSKVSGDIGYYDKKGNIFLVDRLKHVIIVDGNQVAPQELEGIFMSHPKISEAAVVSLRDQNYVEYPIAFIVLKPECHATHEEILEFINSKVVAFKRISRVIFTMTLPRTTSGKILRRLLKEAATHYV